MKSPGSSVGIIEPEGIRNGSTKNERKSSTARITGKNERAYSTRTGSLPSSSAASRASSVGAASRAARARALRAGAKAHRSMSQITPVTNVARTRRKAKSKCIGLVPFYL